MKHQQNIIECYNKTAVTYAKKYMDELEGKHLDQILLKAFANENKLKGGIIDIGCGPGQTTRFLTDYGVEDIMGVDLSPEMIAVAKELNPKARFEAGDMLNMHYADESFGAIVAFYAIVHLGYNYLSVAFKEFHRVIKVNGQALFSYHIGDDTVHMDTFLDEQVDIDFIFYRTEKIKGLLLSAGFRIVDIIERQPYTAVEYPSRRAYIWVEKN